MLKYFMLFYQDFNEQFEGYTQPDMVAIVVVYSCCIRISMNNLKDIHNCDPSQGQDRQLFYQDLMNKFEGYTQRLTA